MNYFFGFKNDTFQCQLQIPLFQNRVFSKNDYKLFKSFPRNNEWVLEDLSNHKSNEYFYLLNNDDISNEEIYFLAKNTILDEFDHKKLKNFNSFTDTNPEYRSNFKLSLIDGGFSSYQSDYPYSMISKKGSVVSQISSIANSKADKNYILFKNIYEKPIQENFKAYLIDYKIKKIEQEFIIKTNYTNLIHINTNLIRPEIFLVTDKYLGIPIYISEKNKHLSIEHTHPPHVYILTDDKYSKINSLKNEMHEIINKKIS